MDTNTLLGTPSSYRGNSCVFAGRGRLLVCKVYAREFLEQDAARRLGAKTLSLRVLCVLTGNCCTTLFQDCWTTRMLAASSSSKYWHVGRLLPRKSSLVSVYHLIRFQAEFWEVVKIQACKIHI